MTLTQGELSFIYMKDCWVDDQQQPFTTVEEKDGEPPNCRVKASVGGQCKVLFDDERLLRGP